ncbi:MAG: hypothetical protein QME52_05885, partial [Bacteroidota bacterium]|nr:hypothetical protein [Bacteroidota bacterium]
MKNRHPATLCVAGSELIRNPCLRAFGMQATALWREYCLSHHIAINGNAHANKAFLRMLNFI